MGFAGTAAEEAFGEVPHARVRLGEVGRTIDLLHRAGIEEVVLAGSVARPTLKSLRPDGRALRMLAGLRFSALGDDALLSLIVAELEREGFRVVGIDSLLADLLAPAGPIGSLGPDDAAHRDIAAGMRAARALGAADKGQAVVVRRGGIVAVEEPDGTDALLCRCIGASSSAGGVLVKLVKPGQERRADLPTIGPRTVTGAEAAGLRGIAVEAGGTLIIDRARVAAAADAAGLFVVGVVPGET